MKICVSVLQKPAEPVTPGRACCFLTFVADTDALVHDEAEERHDNAQKGQEHPVLSQLRKSVPPYEAEGRSQLAGAFPSVLVQFLVAEPVFLLPLPLERAQAPCLFFCVFTEVFGVTPIHLQTQV